MEFTSLSRRASQLDGTLHCLHDCLGNRHAKTGTLNFLDRRIIRPCKGIENILLELRVHADTVILHPEMTANILFS